ncbi:SDR family oxidoreductase [Devosia rhodophyticola]|uniref:SDR family oxidoreductase n=1 Tax=Devosia rhodophyticola TaxID=3026423 RepID=A0ABY7Z0B2_9HYPH|nr:SDR family oxidoreductase [Devosia rhodophyticola]WDR06867.1 SDR family oxidoreductase [Devosia rhodophyticola]
MNEAGKTVLVTGAAMGIGRAAAEALAAEGKNLVLFDRDAAALKTTVAEIGGPVLAHIGSVSNLADCEAAVALAREKFGGLSGVSHNAGIQRYGDVLETSEELWAEVLDVNLTGAFLVAKAAMPELRRNRGAIVLTASVQGMAAQKGALAYVVSKHALVGLVTAMAVDEAANGVRVVGVAPGSVDTPLLRAAIALDPDPEALSAVIDAMHPLGRRAEAAEIASVIAFLLSEKASFITGETVRVDGGLLAQLGGAPKEAGK